VTVIRREQSPWRRQFDYTYSTLEKMVSIFEGFDIFSSGKNLYNATGCTADVQKHWSSRG